MPQPAGGWGQLESVSAAPCHAEALWWGSCLQTALPVLQAVQSQTVVGRCWAAAVPQQRCHPRSLPVVRRWSDGQLRVKSYNTCKDKPHYHNNNHKSNDNKAIMSGLCEQVLSFQ